MKIFLPQFFPQMLNWIDLRAVSWLLDQTNVLWNHQLVRAMPTGLIDLHHDEKVGEGLAHMREKEIHHLRVSGRQDEGRKPAKRRSNDGEDIHRLAHHLRWNRRPYSRWCPTPFWTTDPA